MVAVPVGVTEIYYLCSVKKRYFIYLSYLGTNYHGWQIQPNGSSIQEVLTTALRTVLGDDDIEIVGAGRTDTGVHARLMTAHFDSKSAIAEKQSFIGRMNGFLPFDIAVHDLKEVKPDAHARFDAIGRCYEYHVTERKNVFKKNLVTRIGFKPDYERMNEAAAVLRNYTDFTSFSKRHTDVKTNNCIVARAEWTRKDDEWIFTIEADRFLRNMVRAIVGTLFEVGKGKITLDEFHEIITAKDRCRAGASVPAQGLYLVDIGYPDELFVVNERENT
ncbi:MAG: tRNA pseudouridine(38-40) synthase TruA [Prevotellaceae bacterium]|jgi:tRNA pseudouridine38-40 synthase|nr:tRNA pseudouridine(38-40) synthase TruA [Prevotellaceae bacterium]